MPKLTIRKLKLNKETVRLLSDDALRLAVGGTTSATANPFCTGGTCASVGCVPHTAEYETCGWTTISYDF